MKPIPLVNGSMDIDNMPEDKHPNTSAVQIQLATNNCSITQELNTQGETELNLINFENNQLEQDNGTTRINTMLYLRIQNEKTKPKPLNIPTSLRTILNNHLIMKNIDWSNKQNDILEKIYPRSEYGVYIYSQDLDKFSNVMSARLNEINRCVKVKDVEEIQMVKNAKTNDYAYRIKVNNFKDYCKLRNGKNWPRNAFKNGVTVETMPPDLTVNIIAVDKHLSLNQDCSELIELRRRFGLINVERITSADGEPTNKLMDLNIVNNKKNV